MTIRRASAPIHGLKTLAVDADGTFEAVVAVFGNVDLGGDRIAPGAFTKSLARWDESGDPIPVIWSHQWDDPFNHIGEVTAARELYPGDDRLPEGIRDLGGLWVRGRLDMEEPKARQAWKLLKKRRTREFSFAYDVMPDGERRASDGVNDLVELDLIEVGPTLKGMNPATQLLDVKSAIGSHSTGTSDDTWDGPANEANLSNDAGASTYRRAYAWRDPDGDADTKSSYRFIHHFVSDSGTVGAASTRACVTGIGVLNGARGGTTIPDGDRQGVYNHLARHLRDADQEPPELNSSGQNAAGVAATKAQVTLSGCVEERQQAIVAAVRGLGEQALSAMTNGGLYAIYLEATFDDSAVVLLEGWDDPPMEGRYWQFPIRGDGDEVALGDPQEVSVTGVASPKARRKALRSSLGHEKTVGNPEEPRVKGDDPGSRNGSASYDEIEQVFVELDLLEI